MFINLVAQYQDSLSQSSSSSAVSAGLSIITILAGVGLIFFVYYSVAKVFMKAGRQWWEAIIPIYNTYVLLRIVGRPWWWLLLLLVPFVNLVISIIIQIDLAKSFGRGVGTGLLLILFPIVMFPVMAFGESYKYVGPSAATPVQA